MRLKLLFATLAAAILLSTGCETARQREAERQREEQDQKSAAFRAGQAAHEIAKEAEKAAAAAGRKLDESARKAREGWKDQERKDQERKDRERP